MKEGDEKLWEGGIRERKQLLKSERNGTEREREREREREIMKGR